MKACLIREHGDLSKVQLGELPNAVPARGEVLVRVKAAALNHLDLWVLKGRPGTKLEQGHVLGSDAAGTVVALGMEAKGFAVGDEVVVNPSLACGTCERCRAGETSECENFTLLGVIRPGTFSELVSVPADCLAPRPKHLSWEESAALTLAHLTAYRMLFTRARLAPGETVLIHGIGGGVALAGLQLAHLAGARAIVTSSSREKLEKARTLGAAGTIDYKKEDVAKRARELNAGRGVDVVLDTVGAATLAASLGAVRKGGRIVTCGATSGSKGEIELREIYWNQVTLMGSTMGSQDDLRLMLRFVEATKLRPVVSSVRPLAEARAALEEMDRGAQMGKLVLRVQ